MDTTTTVTSQPTEASFMVRGRMFPYEEFTCRLKNLCAFLGFGPVTVHLTSLPVADHSLGSALGEMGAEGSDCAVCVVSTKVQYNPNWGVYNGHPRHAQRQADDPPAHHTPADFIAPFLHLYRFAQENIFISQTFHDQWQITVPETLLHGGLDGSGHKIRIHLDHILTPTEDGQFCPVAVCGSHHSFALAESAKRTFAALTGEWAYGRKLSIGPYLGRELFSFEWADSTGDGDSPYASTILPHIAEIVTHPTPNLRAAEIHLQEIFSRTVTQLDIECRKHKLNLLYVAGLEIERADFGDEEQHYFVPWQAYIAEGGKSTGKRYLLAQDDLFVQLKQQDRQCHG